MRPLTYAFLALLLLSFSLFVGCETTKNMKASISSKVDSMTSDVDQDLYAQVPEDDLVVVKEAEYALLLATEQMRLAELKDDLAHKQKKHAGYGLDLAQKNNKAAKIELDIAKLEAIDRAGLGEKQENIETIADLKAEALDIQSDKVKIEAKISSTQMDIENLKNQIKVLEDAISNMKM
jgi:multidrug resistance efflux pump